MLSVLTLLAALAAAPCAAAPAEEAPWSPAEYVKLHLENSPAVRRSRDSVEIARARELSQYASTMFPSLSLSASLNPAGLAPGGRFNFDSWRASANDWTVTPGASWNLFNHFKDSISNKTRSLATEAAEQELESVRQSEALSALRAYYRLLRAQRIVEVAERNLEVQKQNYALTQNRYKNGMKSLFDLLKTETDWRSAELNLENRIAEQRLALFQFNVAIERKEDAPVAFPAELTPGSTELPLLDDGMREAMARRPEIVKNGLEIESADLALRRAKIDAGPTVALDFSYTDPVTGAYGVTRTQFGLQDAVYGFRLGVSLPGSFNFYSQAKNLQAARALWRQSRDGRTALHRSVREEVVGAHIQLVRAIRSLEIAQRKEDISRQNLDLIKLQYEQGSVDVIRLSQVQIDFVNAQIERLDAFRDANINRAAYRRVIGESIWR